MIKEANRETLENLDFDSRNELYRITEKLRGNSLEDCLKLINNYLKENIKARDFRENDEKYSTARSALVDKEANSEGFIKAFLLILEEAGLINPSQSRATLNHLHFNYKGKTYSFAYLMVCNIRGATTGRFSPYTEKLCSNWLVNHEAWFENMTFCE